MKGTLFIDGVEFGQFEAPDNTDLLELEGKISGLAAPGTAVISLQLSPDAQTKESLARLFGSYPKARKPQRVERETSGYGPRNRWGGVK